MNYRHAFHAGNFADCVKHALLVHLLHALRRKEAPFGVLDTHAGAGGYDLSSPEAQRTGEWRDGIGRLAGIGEGPLAEYLALVGAVAPDRVIPAASVFDRCRGRDGRPSALRSNADGVPECGPPPMRRACPDASSVRATGTTAYPGSPALARALLRPQDRLACCELHPEDHAALRARFRGNRQVAVHRRDGWEALRALTPFPERRGLVLVDPPFEQPGEFERLAAGLALVAGRFRAAVQACWYPIKHRAPVRAFHAALQAAGLRDLVAAELWLREPTDAARLNGCGLLVANPPYRFEAEAGNILASLLQRLGDREAGEGWAMTRIAEE